MDYIKKAVSNSSTLISFYRTEKFYPLLKVLFSQILIPKDCWDEVITGKKEDYKFADRRRMLNDKGNFLKIVKLNAEERKICSKLIKIAKHKNLELHKPEALAISLALNRNVKIVLTEDKIALEILKNQPNLLWFNVSRVFQELIKHLELFFVNKTDLNEFLDEFEKESQTKFSRESRESIIKIWEKEQKGLFLD